MTDPRPVVDLDDDEARDRTIVGAKAARLAEARRAGLPVLPGVVVPVAVARPALAAGAEALERGGSGRARLALMDVEVPADVLAGLTEAAGTLGTPLVVRSSSPMEGDAAWSGTFSSFDSIGVEDLRTAVRGVWASVFTVHAVERCEALEVDPADVELAVLVQPQVEPVCGGSARLAADGSVGVHAIAGAPRDLLQGWETGVRARVVDGVVVDGDAAAVLGDAPILAAAALVHRTREALGDDLIEWAWVDGAMVLLQSTAAPAAAARATAAAGDERLARPEALEAARLVHRFPGPLGERLVLPWAFGLSEELPEPFAVPASTDPAADLARATELAAQLTKQAWQHRSDGGRGVVDALAALRGPDPVPALELLATTRRVDPEAGAEVLRLVASVAAALVESGRLRLARRVWRSSVERLEELVRGAPGDDPQRHGPDRWEPFVHAVVREAGRTLEGLGVVAGIAAGRVVVIRDPHAPPPFDDRDVLVADRPLPALAPLLFRAAALVTTTGNPAAHLMEVANSLALPTVLGVDLTSVGGLTGLAAAAPLAAVDGETGEVALLDATTTG
jgi:phosphohistidine swiveling domain-containing protein